MSQLVLNIHYWFGNLELIGQININFWKFPGSNNVLRKISESFSFLYVESLQLFSDWAPKWRVTSYHFVFFSDV